MLNQKQLYIACLFSLCTSQIIAMEDNKKQYPNAIIHIENGSNHPVTVYFSAASNARRYSVRPGFTETQGSSTLTLHNQSNIHHSYVFTKKNVKTEYVWDEQTFITTTPLPDDTQNSTLTINNYPLIKCTKKTLAKDDEDCYFLYICHPGTQCKKE